MKFNVPFLIAGLGFALILNGILAPYISAKPLVDQVFRGKQLFSTGSSATEGIIRAFVGQQSVELPGNLIPCVSCHGEDGLGRPEGGIKPSNITWRFLTKPYGHLHDNLRKHPAFTEQSFTKVIRQGVDPAGNSLDSAMPRYQLSDEDISDLIAYLKILSTDYDAGITATSIKVASILPINGRLRDMGQAMNGILNAYFSEINKSGGIYNRKIELEIIELSSDPKQTITNLQRKIDNKSLFALISTFAPEVEKEVLRLTEKHNILNIGPYSLLPETDIIKTRSTFYLLPGIRQMVRALVDFSVVQLKLKKPQFAIVGTTDVFMQEAINGIEIQRKKHGLAQPDFLNYLSGEFKAERLMAQIKAKTPDVVFFNGDKQDLLILMESLNKLSHPPYIFLLGSMISPKIFNLPREYQKKLYLAYPVSVKNPVNPREFLVLQQKYGLTHKYLVAQIVAYSSAKLLLDGLKRTGKDLSSKKLINTIEKLYQFDRLLTPPVTYRYNRHIGAIGAYVETIDHSKKGIANMAGWLEVE